MKILSVECSAGPASAAITENGRIIASSFVNIKLTHSQTLIPMISGVLKSSLTDFSEIDALAVACGPGSFTGIRIGISAVKGLAASRKLPCIPVSTLAGMAELFRGEDSIVCAVMDARCNQVYNALFDISGDEITRLCDDRALMCDELKNEISAIKNRTVIICGDGTDLFYPYVQNVQGVKKANATRIYQNAEGIGLFADRNINNDITVNPEELLPFYLRLPQAERELKAKLTKSKE